MIGLALSASQAAYDAVLDLTGVRVGTFRAVALIATQIAIRVVDGFVSNDPWHTLLSVPTVGLLWFTCFNARARCRIDNRDQSAGRFSAVNARAQGALDRIVGTTTLFAVAFIVMSFVVVLARLDGILFGAVAALSFWLFYIHECLFVRERNEARFRITSPARTAGGAA